MKLKANVLKRIISVLCAISMSTSFLITSAGAIDTNNAEVVYSMQYLNSLPKLGEANFDKFSGKYERDEIKVNDKRFSDTLQEEKVYENVKFPNELNGKNIKIREKDVYANIKKQVQDLKTKVEERKSISKHGNLPEEMRLAKAIYRWVAKNIPYDDDSLKVGTDYSKNGEEKKMSLRKPQDPLFVFDRKMGVCVGKANLVNLMMRIAGIPSAVIVSEEHAFNAIYLKDAVNNREGWTLIDATWGAPKSDMESKAGEKIGGKKADEINKMIKGKQKAGTWFMSTVFDMNDEYSKKINEMLCVEEYSFREKYLNNNVEIEEYNKKVEEKLKQLNDSCSGENGFKINKLKIVQDGWDFIVEYETNLTKDGAEDLCKTIRKRKEDERVEALLKGKGDGCLYYKFGKEIFDQSYFDELNRVNQVKDFNKLDRSKEYCSNLKAFCDGLVKEHEDDLRKIDKLKVQRDNITLKEKKDKIDDIFKNINAKLEKYLGDLNDRYKDIVVFKDFKIQQSKIRISRNLLLSRLFAKMSLSEEDARDFAKKESDLSDKMKQFFPAFYNRGAKFEYANGEIIDWPAHKFEEIVVGNWHDRVERVENLPWDMQIDGVTYRVWRSEKGYREGFELIGNEKEPLSDVEISFAVTNLKEPLKIGSGIKSIKLKGNEILDLSEAKQLESIDITDSKAYVLENGVLYEKNSDTSIGKKLNVPSGVLIVSKKAQRQ